MLISCPHCNSLTDNQDCLCKVCGEYIKSNGALTEEWEDKKFVHDYMNLVKLLYKIKKIVL